jgi:hypothetical protein
MFEPKHKPRTWGFRFFATDAVVIGVLAAAAIGLQRTENPLWWMLIVVAVHFFLFCNVFRVRRSFETVWAALFLANSALWLWLENLNWLYLLAIQLTITFCVIVAELRSHRYHGVFATRANPRLNDYLEGSIP